MKDSDKTKEQLISELEQMHQRIVELDSLEAECKRTEEATMKNEEKLQRMFESVTDGIVVTDLNGNIMELNEAAVRLRGSDSKEKLIGQSTFELIAEKDRVRVMGVLKSALEDEQIRRNVEITFLTEDGREYLAEVSSALLRDGAGNSAGFIAIFRDIAERKQAEKDLKKNEQFLNSIFESVQDGVSVLNQDLTIRHVNGIMNKWYKENLPLEGKKCYEVYQNADKPCEPCPTLRCWESGKTEWNVVPGLPGSPVEWIELFSYPIKDPKSDKVTGVVEFVRDITERKQAEEEIRSTKEYAHNLVESSLDMIIAVDNKRMITQFNKAAEETFGYSQEEVIGKHVNLLYANPREGLIVHKQTVLNGQHVQEIQNKRKNGEIFPSLLSASVLKDPDGNQIGVMGVSRDITERQQAEEALQESEQKLRYIVENSTNLFYSHTPEHELTYLSPQSREFLQCDPEEAMVRWTEFATDNPVNEQGFELTEKAIKTGKRQHPYQLELVGKKGRVIWVEVHEAPVVENDKTVAIVGALTDITERKQAEVNIINWKNRYEAAIMSTGQILYDWDSETNEVIYGGNLEGIIGYTIEEMNGGLNRWKELIHLNDRKSFDELIKHLIETKEPSSNEEYRVCKKNGEYIYVEDNGQFFFDASGKLNRMIGFVKDITERKKVEEDIKESEQKYRRLVESLENDYIIYSHDTQGMFSYLSPSIVNVLGYTQDEFMRHYTEYMTDSPINKNVERYTDAGLRGEKQLPYEAEFWHKDGSRRHLEVTEKPVLDKEGNVLGIDGIVHNITERKQKEEELRESAAYLDIMGDALMVLDSKARMVKINRSFSELWGYNPDEVIGKPVFGMFPEEELSKHQTEMENAAREGNTRTFETIALTKDKKEINVFVSGRVLKDEKGKVLNFIALFHNITERKQAEKRLNFYTNRITAINKASHVLASSLDFQTVVEQCAHIVQDMFEASDVTIFLLEEDGLYLTPIFNLGPYKQEIMAFRLKLGEGFTGKVAENGKAQIVNRIDLTDIGKQVPDTPVEPESLMCAPIKMKNKIIGTMTLSKLGLEEFQSEDLEFLENLADISAAAIQNAQLYEASRKSERLKTLFLANMSHEIRTPLTSIVGYSDLIETNVKDKLGPEEKQFFDIIRSSNERLLRTIHGTLDISQIEAMSFEVKPEQFDLSEITEMIVSEFYPKAREKNLNIDYNTDAKETMVKADKYCIQQALSNLLDNAIKYTEEGGVSIDLKQQNKKLILTVADTGIGISKEYQKELFETFSQESVGYTKRYQGVGLGLALTKRYLDLNEIPIDVESADGVGTKFTLTFTPVLTPKPKLKKEEQPVQVAPVTEKERCILIVEDDHNAQNLFKFFLRNQYDMCFTISVAEAKQQLKEQKVDLVLLDLSLIGDEDGLNLASYMRKSKRWKKIPIIAVTAHAFTKDRENVLNAGCDDYMAKPIKKQNLIEMIEKFI